MPQLTVEQAMRSAAQHFQAGRLQQAEEACRLALRRDPRHIGVLQALAMITMRLGRPGEASELLGQVAALEPGKSGRWIDLGLALRTAGKLPEATEAMRKAIALDPRNVAANSNLGGILAERELLDEAVAAYRQALALDPNFAIAHTNLGNALRKLGRLDEAEAAQRRAIELDPTSAPMHSNLGSVLLKQRRTQEAIEAQRKALALQPNNAEAIDRLGQAFMVQRKYEQAVAAHRRALELNPHSPIFINNLGNALRKAGKLPEAEAAHRRAVELNPDSAEAICNLANTIGVQEHWEEAIALCRRAIEIDPRLSQAYSGLGLWLGEIGRNEEAMAACLKAVEMDPASAEMHFNLGCLGYNQGRFTEAEPEIRRAIELDPDYADAHWRLGAIWLLQGDNARGWEKYEWRWKCDQFTSPQRNFSQPQWDGRDLEGKTILLHGEQGLGDSIQAVRFVPAVARRGGKVILEINPELRRLTQNVPGVDRLITFGEPLPPFDVHCPLMSLPRALGPDWQSAATVPYLIAEPDLCARWAPRIAAAGENLRVAINWAGNPAFKADRTRSLSLDRIAGILATPGVTFYSIQKGAAAPQAEHPSADVNFVNLGPELNDFADTAAVMSLVDLVITTDTSVAHLAGALGRPTWVLLQFIPDWRWLLEREDSPWYPTMRLFRQKTRGQWDGPMARVVESLNQLATRSAATESAAVSR